jgi:O-antigen/teichoic acid export membrane protein
MKEPDAKRIYGRVSTYVLCVLVLLVAGLCAVAPDLIRLATTARFHAAAPVTPWIALGVLFQGVYLVGSIGLVITKRTSRYPLATGIAAVTSVAANALLIPAYGVIGAAVANTISYATLAGVTVGLSYRLYPIPYEWDRLLRIVIAASGAYVAARMVLPLRSAALPGLLVRGTTAVLTYAVLLWISGFFLAGELDAIRDIQRRAMRVKTVRAPVAEPEESEMAGEIVSGAPVPITESSQPVVPTDPPAPADTHAPAGPPGASAEVAEPRVAD